MVTAAARVKMKFGMMLMLLGILTFNFGCCLASQWSAVHNPLLTQPQMLMPVRLGDGHLREKREAVEMTQPIRILPVYADSVDTNLQETGTLIREEIIPKVLGFVKQSLMVAPLPGPILLNPACTTVNRIRDPSTGDFTCIDECAATTTCGFFPVPMEHLKQCIECGGSNDCVVSSPAQDGAGVTDYDYVLYITAVQSICPSPVVLAFAGFCTVEVRQDRPIAGFMNFCPDVVRGGDPDSIFTITKHEVLHALGFGRVLFALWRDPTDNQPRTPRNPETGLPNLTPQGFFEISVSTIETETFTDWFTVSGPVSHTVSRLITPAVRREAQDHFNCPTLAGVELENQGEPFSLLSHWEKRILGNEAMTAVVTFNPVFSRLTFAAFEDSGWYRVNYSNADELIWGRGAGCRFAEGSCGEWIDTQRSNNQSLSPFCNVPESASRTGCTADHEAVSKCNLVAFELPLPAEFQYFQTPQFGGRIDFADFCPSHDVPSVGMFSGTCSVSSNTPPSNNLLEAYGPGSRCVTHGRQWTLDGAPIPVYGGGCYQYSCSGDAVTITIDTEDFVCSCSQAGQEMMVNLTVSNQHYQGSILCPSCTQICHVPSRNIITVADTNTLAPGDGGDVTTMQPGDSNHASCLVCSQILLFVFSLLSWALCR